MVDAKNQRGSTGKKFLIGAGIIIVLLVVTFAFVGWPPSNGGEGTVVAAKKHQAEQIKAEDVSLQDAEIQELLQDDEVLALVCSDDFRRMADDPQVANMVFNKEALQILVDPDYRKWATGADPKVLEAPILRKMAEATNFARWAGGVGKFVVEDPIFAKMASYTQFTNFLKNANESADFMEAFATAKAKLSPDDEFRKWAETARVEEFINANADALHKLADIQQFAMMCNEYTLNIEDVLNSPTFHKWIELPKFEKWCQLPVFAKMVTLDGTNLMRNTRIYEMFDADAPLFAKMAEAPKFCLVMQDNNLRRQVLADAMARYDKAEQSY